MSSYALFQGPDLAVDFGNDARAALEYMGRNADELADGEAALFVFDGIGNVLVALVSAEALERKGAPAS